MYTQKKKNIGIKKSRRLCNNYKRNKTCYKTKDLKDMAKKLFPNESFKNKKIKKTLKKKISKELGEDEYKWISKLYSDDKNKKKKLKSRFSPQIPKEWKYKKDSWLSNIDINKVISYFQKKYKKFHYLKATSRDFDKKDYKGTCLVSNLCSYKLKDLEKKYNSFGVIFNTDLSYEPGQHWNALYVDIIKGKIYFYDSFGTKPNNEVINLMNRFKNEKDLKRNYEIYTNENTNGHQSTTTECGMYSIYFLVRMLKNESFNSFINRKIPDKYVYCLRRVLFDDYENIYYECSEKTGIKNI